MKMYHIIILYVAIMAALGNWTDRNLEWCLSFFVGRPVEISLWADILLNLVASPLVMPFNVGCEIIRMAVS